MAASLPRAFSKRTIAIAVAAAVAVSGVQFVAPATSPITATSYAQDVQTAAETVTLEGIYLRENDQKYDGVLYQKDEEGKFVDEKAYKLRFKIDLKTVNPDTVIRLNTHGTVEPRASLHRFTPGGSKTNNAALLHEGKQIGSLTISGTSATLKFDQIENLPQRGSMTLDLDLYQGQYTVANAAALPANVENGQRLETELPVEVTRIDGTAETKNTLKADNDWYSNFYVAPDYTDDDLAYFEAALNPQEDGRVDLSKASIGPSRNDSADRSKITMVLKPKAEGDIDGTPYGNWGFIDSEVLNAAGKTLDADNPKVDGAELRAYVQPEGDDQRQTATDLPANMKASFTVDKTTNEITVVFENVPASIQPRLILTGHFGTSNLRSNAAYYGFDLTDVQTEPTSAHVNRKPSLYARLLTAAPNAQVDSYVAEPAITAKVNGQTTSADSPANVGGTTATVTLTISNGKGATASLSAPTVTLEDGTTRSFPDLTLQPGESKDIEIEGWKAPFKNGPIKAEVTYPAGDKAETEFFISSIAPTVTINDGNAPVAGEETTVVVTVPEGTEGTIELQWPDGTTTTHPIVNGKVTVPHTFPQPGEVEVTATVITPDNDRSEPAKTTATVDWPSDLSSIAAIKPECKNALIADGVFAGLGLLLALASQIRITAVEDAMAEIQRQMGIFNPQMADAAREWGPRIAGLGALVALLASFGDTYAKCSVDGESSTGSSLGNSDGSSREDDGEKPEGSASSSDEATDEVAPTDSK